METSAFAAPTLSWRLLEAAVIMFAAFQVVRIALKPPFRRDMARSPLAAIVGWLLALTGATVGVWLMLRWPVVLHVAAIATAVGLAAAWWRARPTYGRRRGWPPGSLGIGASLDAINDRRYYLEQARIRGPVFKMSQFGRPVLCVVGLARGRDLLHANPEALTGASLPYNRFIPKGSLRFMKGEDHRRESPLFRNAFSSLALEPSEAVIRTACRDALASLSGDSRKAEEGVRAREYIGQWLVTALAKVLFGFEPTDPRVAALDRAQRAMVLDRIGGCRWRRQLEAAFVVATGVVREKVREDAGSGQDVSGTALGAILTADPTAIDNESRVRNLFFIFRLGISDATALMDWVLTKLTENPQWQTNVRAEPRTSGQPQGSQPADVASRVVLETLRMEQSEFLYRRVIRPIVVDGFSIPAGWLLRICVQESHRDPAIFPDPDTFNPDRFAGRTFGRAEYSPFGTDNHGCLGATLVRFLGRILVEELCHGYQWRVTRDGPLERGSRHRHHWRPSAAQRIVMVPIE